MASQDYLRDLEELGDTIQDIIDHAVNSRDYQRLNQTITQAVNRAVDTGEEVVRRAVDSTYSRRGYQTNKNIYSSKLGSVSSRPAQPVHKPGQNLPALYTNTSGKMAVGIVKTVGGGILTLGSSIGMLTTALVRVFAFHLSAMSAPLVLGAMGLAGGVGLLVNGISNITRLNRFDKYIRTMGKKTYCELEQLARSVGKPVKYVRKELGSMIEQGYFLQGHMDEKQTSLITSNETYQHYLESQKQLEERKRIEAAEAKQPKKTVITPQVQEVLDRGNSFIRQIRSCNDAIPGEEISAKISRMENIVQKIFDRAEAHPEIVPDLKKLMDYYLPMTVKLLNAYAEMDAQPVQGQTIQASKREIEATLDTLNAAFEKLLDSVFKETALDVSSDISVLQTLLAQEGLTDDEFSQMKKKNFDL